MEYKKNHGSGLIGYEDMPDYIEENDPEIVVEDLAQQIGDLSLFELEMLVDQLHQWGVDENLEDIIKKYK